MGLEHLKSLISCPQAATVAIAENDPKRSKEAADMLKIPRSYKDYRELLEQPDIDAVTIALPNYLHAQVAIEALQARKHVFLEKPMATNAKAAAKILETAKRMRCVLMVAQNFRFNRHTLIAKEMLERGQIGEVYHVRGFFLRRSAIPRIGSWFTQKQFAGGGAICDLGVHMLDTCLHLLGEFEARSVSGQVFSKLGPRGAGNGEWGKSVIDSPGTFDVDDYGTALIKLRSGRTVILEASWAAYHAPSPREYGIDLMGTTGGLSLYPARLFRDGPNGCETVDLVSPKPAFSEDPLHHFVSSILQAKKTFSAVEEALRVQQILDAIYASASSGKEVLLK